MGGSSSRSGASLVPPAAVVSSLCGKLSPLTPPVDSEPSNSWHSLQSPMNGSVFSAIGNLNSSSSHTTTSLIR
eukprot:3939255-Amphidinium_carterae.1